MGDLAACISALRESGLVDSYGLTFPKGVQVFDLRRAMQIYQQRGNTTQFAIDQVTPGTGVSQEAIVAAIQVRTPAGAMGHFVDMKVADMIVGGTNSQPVVVLAGSIPLAVVDPIGAHTLHNQTTVDVPGIGSFTFGRAVALGTLGNKRVAVLVGTGAGMNPLTGAVENGYVLGVFDMTNPASPLLIGTVKLAKSPSDVVLRDRKAVVAAEGVGLIVDLSDPTKPRVTGEIPNVAGNIALSAEGLLYSSSMAAAGVKSAVYQPIAFIQPVEPVLITPDLESAGGDSSNLPAQWITAAARTVQLRVVPFISGIPAAVLKIKQSATDFLTDNPLIDAGKGFSEIVQGKLIERGRDLIAKFTIDTPFGVLESRERVIPVGYAEVHVDLNNDTKVDTKDDEIKNENKRAWGFWETRQDGDPSEDEAEPASMRYVLPSASHFAVLEDFAEIRIEIKQQARNFLSPEGRFRLRLKPSQQSDTDTWGRPIRPKFSLSRKMRTGLAYITNEEAMKEQYYKSAVVESSPCNTDYTNWSTQCRSDDEGRVVLPDLAAGQTYDFLFRCLECRADVTKPAQTKVLELEYLSSPGATPVVVDHVLVDIRPIAQWMTMQNARETAKTGGLFRPLSLDNWRVNDPSNRPTQERDWRYDVPSNAKQHTVIVHGFKVPHDDALGAFFPTWFRRMYWSGHRVLRRQTAKHWDDQTAVDDAQGCAGECAHTVVISWPGNDGGVLNSVYDADPERGDEGVQYPEDEFRALQMGYPLAKYIQSLKQAASNPDILLIAHSLGNVVANSALSRPELANNVVKTYIMHDAAMASEVYDPAYYPTEEELTILGVRHAQRYGYARNQTDLDAHWRQEWDNANFFQQSAWNLHLEYVEARDDVNYDFDGAQFYKTRWRQNFGPRWQGDDINDDNAYKSRGDWRGVFAENMNRTTIWNTWSGNDRVLNIAWRAMNLTSKPNPGAGRVRKFSAAIVETFGSRMEGGYHTLDNIYLQRWMLDDYTDNENYLIFHQQNGKWNLKRQWAELSAWFPAVSKAAGYQPVQALGNRNCDFTQYSTGIFSETHSYLKMTELHKIYPAWLTIKRIFEGGGCQ